MFDWFEKLFSSKKCSTTTTTEVEQVLPASIETIPSFPELKEVVLDAFTEVSNQIAEAENVLLFDPKLKKYVANFTKEVITQVTANGDSYDIILAYPMKAGIPKNAFKAFIKLVQALYKEFDIEVKHEPNKEYVVIDKRNAKNLIAQLKSQGFEKLDSSKLTEILTQGPYR